MKLLTFLLFAPFVLFLLPVLAVQSLRAQREYTTALRIYCWWISLL